MISVTLDRSCSPCTPLNNLSSGPMSTKASIVASGILLTMTTLSGGISSYFVSDSSMSTTLFGAALGFFSGATLLSCYAVAWHSYGCVKDLSGTSLDLPSHAV